MNQILYKGYTFGGVGEDVTNKQYGTITIHNPATDQDETYTPVGGENAEIFNSYKGEDRNIASTHYTIVTGFSNKDLPSTNISESYGFNTIGGSYNINKGYNNTLFGKNNFSEGTNNFIAGYSNLITDTIYGVIILGNNNSSTSDYHTLITGYNNTTSQSGYSFVFGGGNTFTDCDYGIYGGNGNTVSDGTAIVYGTGIVLSHANGYSLIVGENIKANAISYGLIFGNLDTNGSVLYSTILGKDNSTKENNSYIKDSASSEISNGSVIIGKSNIFSCMNDYIILGDSNHNVQASSSNTNFGAVVGFDNTVDNSISFVYGKSNIVGDGISNGFIFGQQNTINNGAVNSLAIGQQNTITNGSGNSYAIGNYNTITNAATTSITIGNNLHSVFINGTVLGKYNAYPNGSTADKLLILGNGTNDNNRSNCLEINTDGSQEIILQDKTLTSTLGIGKVKIKQEKIIFESLKENSSQEIETVEFTFEDLKTIKQNSQLPNLDNNSYPI